MAKKKHRRRASPELVVITGLSGSGKGSVLKALEDLGYYSVDNLPVELIPKFAELTRDNPSIAAAALVVDIREGEGLKRFPEDLREHSRIGERAADFSRSGRRHDRAPLQRDAPPASARHRPVDRPQHPVGARAARRRSAPWRI